jgi:hypothetical protein
MAERTTSGASPSGRTRRHDGPRVALDSPTGAPVAERDGIVADLLYAAADLRAGSDDKAVHDLAARLESLAGRLASGGLSPERARRALQNVVRAIRKSEIGSKR